MRSAMIVGLVLLAGAGCGDAGVGVDAVDAAAAAAAVPAAPVAVPVAAPVVRPPVDGARAAPVLVPVLVPVQAPVTLVALRPGEAATIDLRAEVNQIRLDLQAANRLWSNDDRPGAAAAVRLTYDERFSKIEPLLRANDPGGTLALEYQFGVLARQLGRSGKAVEISTAVRAMGDRLVAAQAALPVPAPTNPGAAPTEGAAGALPR